MDFYKLTNFQLYSIINSRHLDKESKIQAEREFARRELSESEIEKLQEDLAEKTKQSVSVFSFNPNIVMLLVVAVLAVFLMKQCVFR